MDDSRMEELVTDYLEGNLSGELKQHVEKKIAKNEEWKLAHDRLGQVYELMEDAEVFLPPASIKSRFDDALMDEIKQQKSSQAKAGHVSWYWMAASIAATIMLTVIVVLTVQNGAQREELSQLQDQIDLNRALVLDALTNSEQSSASSRLVGVNTSRQLTVMDQELEDALFATYLHDENSNVRLAALNALAQFASGSSVRSRLVQSLHEQGDPIVMIQLINVLVRLEEQKAIPGLKKIIEDTDYQQVIRQEAEIGIAKLS